MADYVYRGTDRSACGTSAGYYRHARKKEVACTPCLIAHAAHEALRHRAQNRQTTPRQRPSNTRHIRRRTSPLPARRNTLHQMPQRTQRIPPRTTSQKKEGN